MAATKVKVGQIESDYLTGWTSTTDTWTYASATTFTIAGVDRTAMFPKGTKIKLTQTTAKYFYVTASAFSTNTTITVTGGSDYSLANATITSPYYSYDSSPQGFPQWFAFTPSWTNVTIGNATNDGRFCLVGKTVHYRIVLTLGSTSAITSFVYVSLPLTAQLVSAYIYYGVISLWDSDPGIRYLGKHEGDGEVGHLVTSGTNIIHGGVSTTTPFTWATNDKISISGTYELA